MDYNPQIGDLVCARDYATNEASLGMIVDIIQSSSSIETNTIFTVEWLDEEPGKKMKYGIEDINYYRKGYKLLRETF